MKTRRTRTLKQFMHVPFIIFTILFGSISNSTLARNFYFSGSAVESSKSSVQVPDMIPSGKTFDEVNSSFAGIASVDSVLFWGDWESGTVTGTYDHNWGYVERISTDRISLLNDDKGRQGSYYAKVEVRNGDNPLAPACPGTNRAEVSSMKSSSNTTLYENENSGTKQYSFSIKLDDTWQQPIDNGDGNGKYAIFLQLHGPDALGTNPLFSFSATDQIRFALRGGDITVNPKVTYNLSKGTLDIGHWIDFILTIKYAKTATGSVLIQRRNEGETNFTEVLNLSNIPTLQYSPNVNGGIVGNHYMKYGLYRNNQTFTSILYLDGFTMSTITQSTTNQSPVIQNQTFQLNENSSNGTKIGTVAASDPDPGQILAYSILSGNTGGAFAINTSTGALTVANSSAVNYEVTSSFALVVKVQDNGTGNLSSQATINVSVADVNEAPVMNNQTFTIAENAANGTTAGTIVATDPDAGQTRTFSILSGNTGGAFAINTSTGALTVANSSALNVNVNPAFTISVKVFDNGTVNLFTSAVITISVLPGINQPPVISDQAFTLSRNAPTGTSVGIVKAADPDAGQSLIYSIASGNSAGIFSINSTTGEIVVSNSSALNLKSSLSIELTVKVQDNASASMSNQATVTVTVISINQPPVILNQTKSTLEHQPIGTLVGNISAFDPNSGGPLVYSITSGNTGNGFAINANNGDVTVNNPAVVCFEGNPVFTLSVNVLENEGLSSEALITINVADINEQPVCNNQVFTLVENAPVQTLVGSIIATDNDFNQTLTYSIVSGNLNNAFTIDPSNGTLKVNNSAALNFEENQEFTLVVSVQDNGKGNLITFSNITIKILDVNEPPVMENQILSVAENSAPGTEIGYLHASDPDNGQSVKYTIIGGNEGQIFNLNPASGLLSLADPSQLYAGRNPLITLTAIAQDNGIDSLSTLSVITITLQQSGKDITLVPNAIIESDVSVYPNPTTGIVNFGLKKVKDQPVNITIFNMNGQEIHTIETKGENKVAINLENEKAGTYIARINTGEGLYTREIIIQK